MRGVLQGSVREMRHERDCERNSIRVTLVLDVYAKPAFEDTSYMSGELVEVCFGGALPGPFVPHSKTPVADANDVLIGSW